jgi:hypothetical protein
MYDFQINTGNFVPLLIDVLANKNINILSN